ncbi:MAG TPA: cytochrome c1 [Steroidobacteraceae bacterium]|nr:cytochrome c1 [Steroidobacteraceae bacterium]
MRTPDRTFCRGVTRVAAPCTLLAVVLALLLAPRTGLAQAAAEPAAQGFGSDWQSWRAENSVADLASLQRGARDFLSYCNGCHSLKYLRYSRLGTDLEIPPDLLKLLVPPDKKASDYIGSPMPAADAEAWFGKAPPDLSLMARERGPDYLYRFLTTFYVDSSRPTGANNLALPTTAMPAVLSEREGLKRAVFKNVEEHGEGGTLVTQSVFDHFEPVAPGSMTREQYDGFVRDIVNFLDYVGEPAQVHRRALGIWVVLFLLVFTWLAYLLKKEYWKDVH